MDTSSPADTTVAGIDDATQPVALWVRRGATTVLLVVVVAAVAGLLGVRTDAVEAEQDGYHLTVRYPGAARAGLDTPWEVTVEHPGGFEKEITLAVTGNYFDLFETQGFHPEPAEETRDGSTLYLTFTAPDAETFVVDYDAYIQPSAQRGSSARVSVVDGTTPLVSVDLHTRLLP